MKLVNANYNHSQERQPPNMDSKASGKKINDDINVQLRSIKGSNFVVVTARLSSKLIMSKYKCPVNFDRTKVL